MLKRLDKKQVKITADELSGAITELKTDLLKKDEATELFAHERSAGNISGIVGNVLQSFGGQDVYPTIEEKAAHLLYFTVKNHPFTDGNRKKRYILICLVLEEGETARYRKA